MTQEKIKLIAFDLDGTLIDSVPDLAMAADQTVQALGYPAVSEDEVRTYVGNGADLLIARALSRSFDVDPNLDPELLKRARVMFDDFYERSGHKHSNLYPNVRETLQQLKESGCILAIVTNKPAKFVPEIMAKQQLSEYFSDMIGGETFPQRKPNPVALNWLLDKYQLTAADMLMVGDSKNDILAAKNAGCASFALTYGYNHGEPISASNPDYVADNISELLDIVLVSA